VQIDGRELISFGSNDYLGLSLHPDLLDAAKDALTIGAGATGSRLTSGNIELHEKLESAVAEFKHAEAAIVFSTGYTANIGVISALVESGDLILSDSLNHASLIDGCRLSKAEIRIYRHNDIEHANALLKDRSHYRRLLIVTDSVFSMDGDLARLPELADLADQFDGWLMADDAHGTGVYGEAGCGTAEHFKVGSRIDVQMGTLSKALGTAGGFVAGSNVLIDFLRNKARSFMFSTAPPPSSSAAALAAIRLIQNEPSLREKLFENCRTMRDGLRSYGISLIESDSPIIPVIVGSAQDAVRVSQQLERLGFWIPAIRPPTVPKGLSRLRITVTAAHNSDDIQKASEAIGTAVVSLRSPVGAQA